MQTGEIITAPPTPSIGGKIGGWLDETVGEGASAMCQTCCSPCVLLTAILVLFLGEYTWVKDQNNIIQIEKDMIDGVTAYQAANDGKPVAFYADKTKITAATIMDNEFGVALSDSMKAERIAYMVTGRNVKTKTSDGGEKQTCSVSWTSTSTSTTDSSQTACAFTGPWPITYNRPFKAPCPSGGTTSSCDKTFSASSVTADQYTVPTFLLDYYTRRNTATVTSQESWGDQWQPKTLGLPANDNWFACGNYLSNNWREELNDASIPHGSDGPSAVCVGGYPTTTQIDSTKPYNKDYALPDDHSVAWNAWKVPDAGFTICSKQTTAKTFEELKDNGSYDLMLVGKKSKKDCIQAMKDSAKATVMIMRVLGFLLFWCGFCMMFALVSFFADRVGSLIPCGIGEMFSDCVDCMITVVTCPPACACWIFWWSLAWLIFNPIPYGIFFVVAVVLMGAMYWWFKQQDGKSDEEKPEKEEPIDADQQQNWNTEPVAQPWSSDETPTQPPPPAEDNADANNDGIPDKFQNGLPPGWTAAIDHSSGRIYWIDHNASPAQSTWQDPRAPQAV